MATVKFFAAFREKLGKGEIKLSIKGRKPVGELIQDLKKEYPQLKELLELGSAIVAVNQEPSDAATLVSNEDEIAIFPPVSGG